MSILYLNCILYGIVLCIPLRWVSRTAYVSVYSVVFFFLLFVITMDMFSLK